MQLLSVAICFFVVPMAAFAAEGPSFDCGKTGTPAEELVCGDAELARLDRRLADVFDRALAASEAVAALKVEQGMWIAGRNACRAEDDLRGCVERAYLQREAELIALWTLQPPVAETYWDCGGDPESRMRVTFFVTDLPGIRVEYGDEIHAMQISRSASGARYTDGFRRIFWEKGGEALFVRDAKTELHCIERE